MLIGLLIIPISLVFLMMIEEELDFYMRWLHTLPLWLAKPLGLCKKCFTGQLTLWLMLPLVEWTYEGILTYLGIICINILISYYAADRL